MADCSELSRTIYDLATVYAKRGDVKTIDNVALMLQRSIPELDRARVVESINEVSRAQARTLSDVQKRLARLKKESRLDEKLRKRIEELEKHIKEGTLPDKQDTAFDTPEAIQDLQIKLNDLKKELGSTPAALKEKFHKQIDQMRKRIADNDYAAPVKEELLPANDEVGRLQVERDTLRKKIRNEIILRKPRSVMVRVADPFNFSKYLTTGFDFPPVFRQGINFTLSHPVQSANLAWEAIKSMRSEENAVQAMREIESNDLYPAARSAGMAIRDIEGTLTERGDNYMSTWVEKASEVSERVQKADPTGVTRIPGLYIKGLQASGRGFVTYGNLVRMRLFETLAETHTLDGVPTAAEAQQIAYVVNVLTGEGDLGKASAIAPVLNAGMFAPRYTVSKIQNRLVQMYDLPASVAGRGRFAATPELRNAVAREYVRQGVGTLVLMGAADLFFKAFADDYKGISLNPLNTDFMRPVIGSTSLDIMGGKNQELVLISRVLAGKKVTGTGKEVDIRGEDVPFGGDKPSDLLWNYLRYKASPAVSSAFEIADLEDAVGQETTFASFVAGRVVPMAPRDMLEIAKEDYGLDESAAMAVLISLGVGATTYERD